MNDSSDLASPSIFNAFVTMPCNNEASSPWWLTYCQADALGGTLAWALELEASAGYTVGGRSSPSCFLPHSDILSQNI